MTETPQTSEVFSLPIDEIVASGTNRRSDKDKLKDLTESIRSRGVLQPIMVRPVNGKNQIIFGEQRLKAAKAAGLATIPAIVREMTDVEALEAQLIENCQRQDIHPLEEADDYRRLHEEYGYSADEIAAKVGFSKSHVYGRMKLCSLAAPARKAFLAGDLAASTALLIARIPHDELQKKATKEIVDPQYGEPFSYRKAVEHIQKKFMLRLHDAPFSKTDAELVPKAGACNVCPKRTGNQPELFSDVKSADVCTDPKCYSSKLDAHWERVKADAGEKGYRVLSDSENKKTFTGQTYIVHDSGLVDLDDRAHDVPGFYDKTYRQVLKKHKADIQPVYARDGHGNIRKLADRREVDRALKSSGAKKTSTSTSSSRSDSERRAERQRKVRKTVAKSAVALIADATTKRKPDAAFWRLLSLLAFNSAQGTPGKAVLERHGIKPSQALYGDAKTKKVLEAVKNYSEVQARVLTLDLLLGDVLEYYQGHDGYPLELTEVAKYFKVDLKKLEAKFAEEFKPKPKARKKVLKRKSTKK